MVRYLIKILLIYCGIYATVAISLLLLSVHQASHIPIALTAAIAWIIIWCRIEKTINDYSLRAKLVVYVTVFFTQFVLGLSRLEIFQSMFASRNHWLDSFVILALATTLLSMFHRAARSKRPYPRILKYIFYGIFVVGVVLIVSIVLHDIVSPRL